MRTLFHSCILSLACCLLFAAPASAAWPTKSVKVIVPFNPGGGTDQQARLIEKEFQETFGQPLTFIYKPGADGSIGATELATAKADGYTIAVHTFPLVIMNTLTGKGRYTTGSFDYLAISSTDMVMLVTRDGSPIASFDDFVAKAKAAPGKMTVGCAETLGPTHMVAMKLQQAGVPMNIVPMAGGAKGIAAVLGAHIDALFTLKGAAQTASSKLRYLAAADTKRQTDYPDVPTLTEKNFPIVGMGARIWLAPKGLPAEARERISQGFASIYAGKDVANKHEAAGQPVDFRPGSELASMIDAFAVEAKAMAELYKKTQ